jgi:hypothetical protein
MNQALVAQLNCGGLILRGLFKHYPGFRQYGRMA